MREHPHQENRFCRRFGTSHSNLRRRRIRFSAAVVILLVASTEVATSQDNCRPELVVVPEIEVLSTETAFGLFISGSTDCLPAGSYVYVSGLAPPAELFFASKIGPGSWAIPLWALEKLKVRVPAGFVGSSNFNIWLFDSAGRTLSERVVVLNAKAPVIDGATAIQADPEPAEHAEVGSSDIPAMAAPPVRPPPAKSDLEQAKRMLGQGEQVLARGNIVVAREYFKRSAELGSGVAALRLGETHDPLELRHLEILGLKHDPAEAKRWYERAIELGANEAEAKLRRLGTR